MSKSITQDMAYRQSLMKYVEKHGVKRASRRYNKSRSYIYFWKARWDGTPESLACRSRRPHSHPNQHTEAELKLIRDMRRRNPRLGMVELWHRLRQRGYRQKELGGACEFLISTPKTEAGIRVIPMATEVKRALEQERQFQTEVCPANIIIDGYSNFIFTSQTGGILSPHTVNRVIERIRIAYNNQETELANQEQREPQLLPHFSAHTLRHTFCARFCEHETNLKVIQEIMGHASITTTMDVYNHVTLEQKIARFKRLGETYKII